MYCQGLYYRAQTTGLNNGGRFHVVAVLRRHKTWFLPCTNTARTHPAARHIKPDGLTCQACHAEQLALRQARPGDWLYVMRFRADYSLGMALPCLECQKKIRRAGITKVYYTNQAGEWCRLYL